MIRTLARIAARVALAAPAHAQTTKVGGQVPVESLTAQEREMLALGNEFAKRVADTVERWLASKEVSPDRLFSFLYYPIAQTDPPKFNTDYDRLSDREGPGGFVEIQETIYNRAPHVIIYTVTQARHPT